LRSGRLVPFSARVKTIPNLIPRPALAALGTEGVAAAAGPLTLLAGGAAGGKWLLDSRGDSVEDAIFGKGFAAKAHRDLAAGAPGITSANAAEVKPLGPSATPSAPLPVTLGAPKVGLDDSTMSQLVAAFAAAVAKMGLSLDGKKIGEIVAGKVADQLSRAPSSGTAPDIRQSPWMPGMMGTP
jgi:hypothetical protein